jgi:hypothetical protein
MSGGLISKNLAGKTAGEDRFAYFFIGKHLS